MSRRESQNQLEAIASTVSPQTFSLEQRREQIQDICDEIARQFHPEKILLFGSYAYGEPDLDSDVDILVIMPFEGSPFRQAALILGHIVSAVAVLPLDLLVRTAEQVNDRLLIGDTFMREIVERGKIMYEADHA